MTKTYKCPVHGMISDNEDHGSTLNFSLDGKSIGTVCFQCAAEFVVKTLPKLEEVALPEDDDDNDLTDPATECPKD